MPELVKVDRLVRGVVNGRKVVRRPGDRITVALAVQLGLVAEQSPAKKATPPRPRNAKRPGPQTAARPPATARRQR